MICHIFISFHKNFFFSSLIRTGIVLWRWNRDNSTFFSSAIASVEASPTFGFNPTYTSGVLQQFYDLVSRTQSIVKFLLSLTDFK